MSDIASLGIKVESNLKTLNKDMEKTISLSEKVTNATEKMKSQMAGVSSTTKNVITEEVKRQRSVDNLIKSLTMQDIKLSSGKAALVDYKLSLLGATEAEKKQAAAISANIKKMEDSALAIRKAERASTGLELVSRTLTSVLTTLGATFGVRKIIDYADMWTMVEGRMSLVTKNTSELIAVQGKLFELAQETRMSFESTADLYTRVARSTESVTKTQNDLLSATENINKAMIISGSSVESANAAIIQLGQGFASGRLQGDELRSVLEQTPRLAKAIADGMGVAVGELRKLGKEGKLTSEAVFKSILSQSAVLEQEFGKMPKTVKQGLTLVDNAIMKFIGQMNDSYGVTKTLAGGLTILSENIEDLAKAGFVLLGAAIPATITAIASAMKALTVIMTRNPIGLIAVGVSSAVAAMIAYKDSVFEVGTSTASALEWAKSAWNETGSVVVGWGVKMYTTLTEAFKGTGEYAGSVAAFIGTTYTENFSKLLDAGKKTINVLTGIFVGVGKFIGQTAAFIYESFEIAFNGVIDLATAVGRDLKEALSGDVGFSNTISTASEASEKSLKSLQEYASTTGETFKNAFTTDYIGAFGASVAQVGANISKGAKELHATTIANAKEKSDADISASKSLDDKMKKTKTSIELSKEELAANKKAASDEKKRLKFIEDYVARLEQEADTYKKGKEYTADYVLSQKDATEAQKQRAMASGALIDAAKNEEYWEKKRVQQLEDFEKLMKRVYPSFEGLEKERQEAIELTAKIYADKLIPVLGNTIAMFKILDERENKLSAINSFFDSEELKKFKSGLSEVESAINSIQTTSFGNELADGINNAVVSMRSLNNYLEKQTDIQDELNKKREDAKELTNEKDRKKALKEIDDLEEKNITNQLSGYRQLFGTTSQLFKENSREREVMHNIEMAFAAAEIAMNLEKTISAAYLAIAESGTLPPPASFAAIAAMTALMAGIVAAAGGSLSGGGSASAPSVSASSTQGTGTVMGNPSEKSQSANNALEFMKDIEAKQYNELRDINKGVVDLNNNITNLVTSIVRTGAGTGDMGIKTGTSTSTSELQNISSKGFLAAANLMSLGTISASQAIASLTKNIPVLGNITSGVSDWINDTVSSFSSAVFGGTKKTSILAQGLEVSTAKIGDLLEGAGLDIQKFADIKIKKSGGLFGSDKTYLKTITEALTPDEESIKVMFTNVFKNVGETMVAISSSLNLGEDNLAKIYQYVFDIGKIDLKGLDSDQINETIAAVINTASDEAVTALFGELIGKYVQVGEALLETAIRVVSERAVVLDILEMTGQGFKDSDIPAYSLEITQSLISVAGGIKELQEASVNYYDKFFSDEEKQIRLQGQLTDTMASLGTTLPTSRKELRNFVEGLDLTSIAGQEAYVTILGLTDGFDKFFTVIEDGQAITDANNQAIKKNISDIQLASAQMDMTPFAKSLDDINRATNATIETNKALGASESDLANIRAYGDKQLAATTEAEKKRKEAEEAATQASKDATEARIKSLTDNKMIELLEAEGKSTEALALKRSIELAGMEKSLITMQEKIYKLQDEKAAYEITSKAVQERIDKEREVAEAIKAATDAEFQKEGAGLQEAQLENMRAQGKMSLALATERAVESREMGKMVLALKQSTWAMQDKLKLDTMMIEILNLEGKTLEATILQRQLEFATLTEAEKPLKNRIYILQDEAKQKELGNSISQKNIEIMILLGNEEGALAAERMLALASMDPAIQGFQKMIYALEDAKKAEEETAAALKKASEEKKALLESEITIAKDAVKRTIDNQIAYYQELADKANEILTNARELLDRSFESEKTKITKQHEELISGLTARLDEAKTAASELEGVFNSLSSARKGMFVAGSETQQYKEIQNQLFSVLGQAQVGNFSGVKSLSENVGGLGGNNQAMFTNEQEYKRDFFKTYNALSDLEKLTGTQLTEQQQIVKNLETQIEQENTNHTANMALLQAQYDAVIGVNNSVVSFEESVIQFQKAQYAADGANALLKDQTFKLTELSNYLLQITNSTVEAHNDRLAIANAINNLQLLQTQAAAVPAFASGGQHYGGLRIVGEVGPEIEYTPPSNITSNNDLKSIMSNEEVVAELKAMRSELARANFELVKNTGDSSKTLKKFDYDGMPETRTA